jgi:hypothetical protein
VPSFGACFTIPALLAIVAGMLVSVFSLGWCRSGRKLSHEEAVTAHMVAELRTRFQLRKRDGFYLSTERLGWCFCFFCSRNIFRHSGCGVNAEGMLKTETRSHYTF